MVDFSLVLICTVCLRSSMILMNHHESYLVWQPPPIERHPRVEEVRRGCVIPSHGGVRARPTPDDEVVQEERGGDGAVSALTLINSVCYRVNCDYRIVDWTSLNSFACSSTICAKLRIKYNYLSFLWYVRVCIWLSHLKSQRLPKRNFEKYNTSYIQQPICSSLCSLPLAETFAWAGTKWDHPPGRRKRNGGSGGPGKRANVQN